MLLASINREWLKRLYQTYAKEQKVTPELERAFQIYAAKMSVMWLRIISIAVTISAMAFWPTDFVVFDFSTEHIRRFAAARGGVTLLAMGSLILMGVSESVRKHPSLLLTALLILGCGFAGYHLGALGGLELPWFYHLYSVISLTAVMTVPISRRLFATLSASVAWCVAYFIPHPSNLDTPFLAGVLFFLFYVLVLVTLIGHCIYYLNRRSFFQGQKLSAQAEKLKVQASALRQEQEVSEQLLLNILPVSVAKQLKAGHQPIADRFEGVTVLFADICGFTQVSKSLPPDQLVKMLNDIFSEFDKLTEHHGIEKIKTLGDAYMAASGLPNLRDDHAEAIVNMALDMQQKLSQITLPDGSHLGMRIGIASGPVVAGVIGMKKFIYDLWGDTVNTASRMESHGVEGRIHISENTYSLIKDHFECEPRGSIAVKGLGHMKTFLIKAPKLLS